MKNSAESFVELLAWSLSSARAQTLALVVDIPDALWAKQTEARVRDPEWVVGHLLLGDTYLLHLLAVEPLPPDFGDLLQAYGPAAAPESDPPHFERTRVTARLERTGALRSEAVRSIGASGLAQATPDSALASTQPTLGHHLSALVLHEGYHAGQLSVWRKFFGLPPTPWVLAPRG